MKVLLSIHRLAGLSGGAERVFCDLCNGFVSRGYNVDVVTFDPASGDPFYRLNADNIINLMNASAQSNLLPKQTNMSVKTWVRHIAMTAYKRLPDILLVNQLKWKLAYQPLVQAAHNHLMSHHYDVVIAFLPPAFTIWGEAVKGIDQRLILSTHNVPEEDFENPERWDTNPLVRKKRKEAARHADDIIVLRPQFMSYFEKLRGSQDHIHVIPNMLSDVPNTIPPYSSKEKTVLAVGRLEPVKRYDKLIDIWSRLAPDFPDWTLKIFGEGSQKQALSAQISRLELNSSITLCGVTNNMYAEYQKARLFAHTAEFEGFGMSVAEALAYGLPVIAFEDTEAMQDLIESGQNGILAQSDSDFQRHLSKLMSSDMLAQNLSDKAPLSVEAYKPEHILDLFDRVLKKP